MVMNSIISNNEVHLYTIVVETHADFHMSGCLVLPKTFLPSTCSMRV